MDKTAIKKFSIWARNKLIADITYKAGLLGITWEGIKNALPQSAQDTEFYNIGTKEPYAIHGEEIRQRKEFVAAIRKKMLQLEYKDAYQSVIEEVAYTWFNRLIAIRFMEVNDYMPAHIRVLSSESKTKLEPDLVTTPFDAEIEFTQKETEVVLQMKHENQVDALFRFLFIKQCNSLNVYLPKLFEKTSDYTELLLNVSVTDQDGIVYHLIHDIKEEDFNISNIGEDGKPTGQVEIIGWLYQYYNTEPKDQAFALLKKNIKITKEHIPAATQLFTPDWIVRYMVENSVGRLWLEGHKDESLKSRWNYYLDEAEQDADVEEQLKVIREEYKNIKPEEIKVIDPCMGSGHILVYVFDVLMQIYESYGYGQRDAARSIVENNIYGLDIDDRAFQLAYFAVMMKARSYNRRFLTLGIEPNLCAIQESNDLHYDKDIGDTLLREEHRETLQYLLDTFLDAKEYGSILNVERRDYNGFLQAWENIKEAAFENIVMMGWYMEYNQVVPTLAKQANILSQKYDVVVTNPPYMSSASMNKRLIKYVVDKYPISKVDMFAIFIEKCKTMIASNRFVAMITQQAWMFITSYEKLRKSIKNFVIINMAHLGARAFDEISGEIVQTVTFVYGNQGIGNYLGIFCKLTDGKSEEEKKQIYLSGKKRYIASKDNFIYIPEQPYIYWMSKNMINAFKSGLLKEKLFPKTGITTGNNDIFLRYWSEVDYNRINRKWYKLNKGGSYRKWYGNNEFVIDWENNGEKIKRFDGSTIRNEEYYFREGVTWGKICSNTFSARYSANDRMFDAVGLMCFTDKKISIQYMLGYLCSKVADAYAKMMNPTLSYTVGTISNLPFIYDPETEKKIIPLVDNCVEIAKREYDSYEISFDFQKSPLLSSDYLENLFLEDRYKLWIVECQERIDKMKKCEISINKIFIEMYNLQNEMDTNVDYSDITLRKANLKSDIKDLISYAVGCIFGRYSLDKEGLVFAGGDIKNTYAYYGGTFADTADIPLDGKYTLGELGTPFYYLPVDGKEPLECWKVDADNIIPITDEEYFTDDIAGKFVEFVKTVYGKQTLEENLDFIAQALGNKGGSSREVIRNYFIKDFYADHLKVYQKRPIYWLFDSGKQNGFKALIYMHRYNADTIGNLRVDYLHQMERIYESEINRMQDTIDNSRNAREVTAASKRKEKLQKQLKECQEYDEKIGHLALSRIEIDLDDGVKVNYEKVQTARDGKKYQVLAKI